MRKKNKGKNESILQHLAKNKIRVCFWLGAIYLICMVAVWFAFRDRENALETVYYFSQVLCGCAVVLGTVIAIIQYTFNSNVAKIEADKQRKIEAAKLADEFRKTIIPLMNKLSLAYSNEKILNEVIYPLDQAGLSRFNKEEMELLFPNGKWLQYRALIARNYLIETDEEFRMLDQKYRTDKSLTAKQKKELSDQLNREVLKGLEVVSSICTDLSNSLEYMCICFNTNIADDETVYQSLHNAFFQAVQMLYIFTFNINENEHDRLFYNIMVLYVKWKKLNQEKKLQEESNKAKIEERMRELKNHYDESITVKTKC